MKSLTIIPTFSCPYKCSFCFNPKNNDKEPIYLDDKIIQKFLEKNGNNFDKIIISGGEPMTYPKIYFDRLVDYSKKITNNVVIHTFPAKLDNYRYDVEYLISYDFVNRPYAYDGWQNMMKFPKKFDVIMTFIPQILALHPNNIFRKFLLLKNINSVELKPFYKINDVSWKLSQDHCNKYMKLFNTSRLNLPFINVNREKVNIINGIDSIYKEEHYDNYCLLPNGKLAVEYTNEITNNFEYKEISIKDIENIKPKYSYTNDLYSDEIINFGKINV